MFFRAKTNNTEYSRVLTMYGRARGKTHNEVINRVAQQANFRMVKSEKAGGVKRAQLSKFPLNAAANPEKGGTAYRDRFFYAEQASLGVKKGAGGRIVMRPAAYASYQKRRKARGAMAAGFLASARKLGLKQKGARSAQPRPGGEASESVGRKSMGRRMHAYSVNSIEGSYEVGKTRMDRNLDLVIRDMRNFAIRLIQETNNDFQHGKRIRR